MLTRLARWYLRREIVAHKIALGAAWNEGYQTGYRVAMAHWSAPPARFLLPVSGSELD